MRYYILPTEGIDDEPFAASESRFSLAINQHLHLVKGAEWDKGGTVRTAKKGVGSRSPSLITLVIPL